MTQKFKHWIWNYSAFSSQYKKREEQNDLESIDTRLCKTSQIFIF